MLVLIGEAYGHGADLVARYLLMDGRPSRSCYMAWSHLQNTDETVKRLEGLIEQCLPKCRSGGTCRPVARDGKDPGPAGAPSHWSDAGGVVQAVRLRRARHLLETTRLPVAEIASRVGYADATTCSPTTSKPCTSHPVNCGAAPPPVHPDHGCLPFASAPRVGCLRVRRPFVLQRAADELCVAQSAISHRIRQLEGDLGVKLFLRINPRRRPHPSRRDLSWRSSSGAGRDRGGDPGHRPCSTPYPQGERRPGIGAKWLVGRLADFNAGIRTSTSSLSSSMRCADIKSEKWTWDLRYGAGFWPGLVA